MTSPSRCSSLTSCTTAWWNVRIELGADGLDRLDAALAQQVQHLLVDQLDALAVRVGIAAGRRLQRALEVVDDRQQLVERSATARIRLVAPLAFDALAIVVEFGGGAQQPVLQRVLLAAQLVASRRRRLGRSGVLGRFTSGQSCVRWRVLSMHPASSDARRHESRHRD